MHRLLTILEISRSNVTLVFTVSCDKAVWGHSAHMRPTPAAMRDRYLVTTYAQF